MSSQESTSQLLVAEAEKTAIAMMKKAGFDPGDGIRVSVDPKLPIMGYTRPDGKGYRVVVSGGAVDSRMLEGLILHELSHIYRMRSGHPSHNAQVIGEAVGSLGKHAVVHDYQQKVIYDLTNNVQDLYADDIAVPIMKESGMMPPGLLSRFFQDWVKSEPAKEKDATKLRWLNGWIMANNARAIGQMARQGVEDLDRRASDANRRFLSRVDSSIASRFGYFLDLLSNLKEDVTYDDYRRLLADYLRNFVRMTQEVPSDPSKAP
jgi:Family of unknown function (DUF5781)